MKAKDGFWFGTIELKSLCIVPNIVQHIVQHIVPNNVPKPVIIGLESERSELNMDEKMTVKEASAAWGISERRIAKLCEEGKVKGAKKEGKAWLLSIDAVKPADGRTRRFENRSSSRLPLPIGVSDYRLACTEYYYVDKTLLIKDFLDERPLVSLFTRPRRFGKTLNMDMLRTFFEKTDEDTSIYFKDKKIWSRGERYRAFQGKYPVIFLSFKDIKFATFQETYSAIAGLIAKECAKHKELLDSPKLEKFDKERLKALVSRKASPTDFSLSLGELSFALHLHHGVAPIIIIDEYDTPIGQGHLNGFYDEIVSFMRNLFSSGLKDNSHLSFGFLTGVLRVAKESIFSGLNNLVINSVLDGKYSSYFGFTKEEVKEMASYYGKKDKLREIEDWYDGYRFGNTEIYNPWSVINYFRNDCLPRAYWQSTGSNDIIGEVLEGADNSLCDKLSSLLQGGAVSTYIDTGVIYPTIRDNPSSVFSFLLVAGYLKAIRTEPSWNGDFLCQVALPNKEISFVYSKEILQKLGNGAAETSSIGVQEALYSGDVESLKKHLGRFLEQSVSFYDTAKEDFYHGLVLGLCAALDRRYLVTSNRESGDGRYDICLCPKEKKLPGILIELKHAKACSEEKLVSLAKEALSQIKEKNYKAELAAKGVESVVCYGFACSGKKVQVVIE